MIRGQLYLIPTTLGESGLDAVIPQEVQKIIASLRFFIVENVRTTRRYLRKIDRSFPIDQSTFFELNKHSDPNLFSSFLAPIEQGFSIGILSEAGCPAVADPGSQMVALAHKKKITVQPLVGPSSILLALMASGFIGQQFVFHGYLPKEQQNRIQKIKEMEANMNKYQQTQICIETPFRNNHLKDDLIKHLSAHTYLCIAINITNPTQDIQTMSIQEWSKKTIDLSKKNAVFLIGRH